MLNYKQTVLELVEIACFRVFLLASRVISSSSSDHRLSHKIYRRTLLYSIPNTIPGNSSYADRTRAGKKTLVIGESIIRDIDMGDFSYHLDLAMRSKDVMVAVLQVTCTGMSLQHYSMRNRTLSC